MNELFRIYLSQYYTAKQIVCKYLLSLIIVFLIKKEKIVKEK